MLLAYVDDIVIASYHLNDILWFKGALHGIFKIKDLGEIAQVLSIRITRDRK